MVGVDHGIRLVERQILFQSHHPHIDHISPQIGYYSTKVILTGRRFGWKGTVDTEFKKKDGKINIDLWTDTKIIFTIPLNWKLGKINVWAEKTIEWDGKPLHIKSNLVEMKLISRDNGWDAEDDEYFKQMEVADPEARKINGYE